ncbi:MAG: hypothetical protein EBQ80_02830 [Proteobacteria bacterium]|nr:hypothetical protein [Pseudomonadota bacterium]
MFGNEVTRCSNKKCTKLFETLPNSFNWVNADSDDTSPKEAGPKKPKKSVQRELRLAFLKFEKASKIHEAAQAQATPNEQLFIKRGRRYIPVSREGLE